MAEHGAIPEAWIDLPSEDSIREKTRGKKTGYNFGFVPRMSRLMAAHPAIGPAFSKLYGQIMFTEGRLDRREREMVASVAAAAQDCFY